MNVSFENISSQGLPGTGVFHPEWSILETTARRQWRTDGQMDKQIEIKGVIIGLSARKLLKESPINHFPSTSIRSRFSIKSEMGAQGLAPWVLSLFEIPGAQQTI